MSSLISSLPSIIKEVLPIMIHQPIHVTKSTELDSGTGQTKGMVRMGAIVGKSDRICASVMLAHPHTSSAIHHHGSQDTIIYAASGYGTIVTVVSPSSLPSQPSSSHPTYPDLRSEGGQQLQHHHLAPGDFALIPAWTEHQEINDSDEDITWIITRSGGTPEVVNLSGWGGGVVSSQS